MKIRAGFVSNSSSSSFVAFGMGIPTKHFVNHWPKPDYATDEEWEDEDYKIETVYENFEYPENNTLSIQKDLDEGCIWIGNDIDRMQDNETKREFIERTRKEIEEYLSSMQIPMPKNLDIKFHNVEVY